MCYNYIDEIGVTIMEDTFAKLLQFLDLDAHKEAITGKLVELTVDDKRREWFFNIELDQPLPIDLYKRFEDKLEQLPGMTSTCDYVRYEIEYKNMKKVDLVAYYKHVLARMQKKRPRYAALSDFAVENGRGSTLTIVCPKDGAYVEEMIYHIEQEMERIGLDVTIGIRYCERTPSIGERIEQLDEQELLDAEREHTKNGTARHYTHYGERTVKKVSHRIADIPIDEDALTRYKSMHHKADFAIEGSVINIEERQLKQETILFTFVLSDDDDSIYVKKFVREKDEAAFLRKTQKHMMMKVQGTANYDPFIDEVIMTAITIERTQDVVTREQRVDNAEVKRVELHLHSKMSTLDGIDHIESYVSAAKRFKHHAIALTDKFGVQAFPEFAKAVKNSPLKPIFGAEFNYIDEDDTVMVRHCPSGKLSEATYTVFDIETTGLSVHSAHIIEISAIKINDHQIIDRFNRFVKPPEALSDFTKAFTGIQESDVANADTIDKVMIDFKAFFENTVLVAHNADFDMGFVHETLKRLDAYDEPLPSVDTLQIARRLYGDVLKRFNLKAVAKYFKVDWKHTSKAHGKYVHRAEHDTDATAQVFLAMLDDLRRRGIETFAHLIDVPASVKGHRLYANEIPRTIIVLVKNAVGLKNLYKLISLANTKYFFKHPVLPKKVLDQHREGLLVGSGAMQSAFFETALNESVERLEKKAQTFDFLEVQPKEDLLYLEKNYDNVEPLIEATIQRIIKTGEKLNIPVVAVGDVYHVEKQSVKYRDIYVRTPVVGGGLHPLSHVETIPSQYFRTTEEMLDSFDFLDEATRNRVVIDNTIMIADQIEKVSLFPKELFAPTDDFLAREGIPSVEKKMLGMVESKAKALYGESMHQLVKDRLEKELKSITENKFSTVYYISHLLVKKSLDEGYLVGSRGSVGSSLVATLMNITEVNPLPPHYVCPKCYFSSFKMSPEEKALYGIRGEEKGLQVHLENVSSGFDLKKVNCPSCDYPLRRDGHDIPFETFLGFKGDKVPDIDLNFSGDYQPEVHEYIRSLFGKSRAFRAGTISTVADKTAFGYVKGYLEKKDLTLRKAEIERRAKVIAGVKRSTGQHPGGIVVVPDYKEIYDVTPVQYPADATDSKWMTTHFDYHAFEENLFKLDVLGHDDPTMIRHLMDYVKKDPLNFPFKNAEDIPVDDSEVYKLLSGTEVIGLKPSDIQSEVASYGVPEMGTSFVRGMLKASRPKTFADIVKISGLSHGTDVWLNNAEALVTGKHKEFDQVPFKDVIGCRDDIMVYLIQNGLKSEIAFEISEFIRKGKASTQPDDWEGYKIIMRKHNIPEWYIWSAGQIKYMFPKAHATAYVMMALRIAWFKVYRPIYFYSAYFSKRARDFDLITMQGGEYAIENRMQEIKDAGNRASDVEKRLYTVLEVALEMVKRGFRFEPVDIMRSEARDFVITQNNDALRLPFIALDGLGMKVAESIINARNEKAFTSREDIKARTGLSTTLFDKLDALDAFGDLPESGQMNLFDF